jgi:hypothetical protein
MPDDLQQAVEAVRNGTCFVVDQGNLVAGSLAAESNGHPGATILNTAICVEQACFHKTACIEVAHGTFTVIYESMIPEGFHKSEADMWEKFSAVLFPAKDPCDPIYY